MCVQNDIAKTKQDMFNNIVKMLSTVNNRVVFNTPVVIDTSELSVRQIEYINGSLYLTCQNGVYAAFDWIDDVYDWYRLDEKVYEITSVMSKLKQPTMIYAVAMYVANDGWCEHWYPEIVSKFYTDKDCAIAEMERIRDLPKDDRMRLVPCLDCGELEIVEYELAKNS